MRSADRVHGKAGAHVRRDRVSDHFPAAQVHDRGQIQPPFGGREATDVANQLQSGHRRTEVPPDQVRNRGRTGIRLGQIPAPTSRNAGDATLAHQPGHNTPTHRHALALQLTSDAHSTIGRMYRVHLNNQLDQPPLIAPPVPAFHKAAHPSAIVRAVGDQDPAQQPRAEPVAPLVDESEALPRRCAVDQRLRRLAQDLILAAQLLVLAPTTAQLLAHLREREGKIITGWSARHDRTLARLHG